MRDIIKLILKELGREGVDWINLTRDVFDWRAVMNTGMNLRLTDNADHFLSN